MPEIRDPLYTDIFLEEADMMIIDTPEFQRLRWLAQLPTARFVYPGATHSRFAHSIGVMELADRIFRNLKHTGPKPIKRNDEDRQYLRIAALLHDIDTPPYYPVFQEHYIVKDYLQEIRRERVRSVCENVSGQLDGPIDPEIVLGILEGREEFRYLSQIIDCEVGANRLDYLMRDGYYTGVNYGRVDPRILYEFHYDGEQLVLKKEALPLVDTVFNSMFQMKINVYDHRISRLVTRMFFSAVEKLLKGRSSHIADLLRTDDDGFLQYVRKSDSSFYDRIRDRRFLKTASVLDAVSLREMELIPRYFEHFRHNKEVLEKEISSLANAEPIVVDFVALKQPPASPIKAQVNARQIQLSEVPLLRKWYEKQAFEQWKMFVFCEPNDQKRVHDVCEKIFGTLEIGRENEKRVVITPLKDLYARLNEGTLSDSFAASTKARILDLPKHEFLTLKILAILGANTAEEISKQSRRERSTESLILNKLADAGFVEKERMGKKVYFKSTSAVISAMKDLTAGQTKFTAKAIA